ncbi:MAG TPA: type I restriction enzyme HsdR N-terminal domain-containing protein [Cytophagales bacterium]|nr:type I restriction enzyme HsdR N-terminal domain-containing protein [Cytophagales bacterium]
MTPLNLPQFEYKIKNEDGKTFLFDIIRKKFVVLTPEEWVRQHFVHYLINYYKYPKSLIKIETGHRFNTLKKRSDIIIYNRQGKSLMVVECKSVLEKINSKTFYQVATYNMTIKAKYLAVTNGLKHYCYIVNYDDNKYTFLDEIPSFEDVN